MADRHKFISKVTEALGRTSIVDPSLDHATAGFDSAETVRTNAQTAIFDARENSTQLADEVALAAETIGWKVHRASNTEDAGSIVAGICEEKSAKNVLRSSHKVLDQIVVDNAVTSTGANIETTAHDGKYGQSEIEESKAKAFSADVGITGVDYAIAETGTVVLHPRSGLSRLVSLAPPTHIAVLRPGEVLASMDELFAMERNDFVNGELSGSMNLISGPSKTADIEGTTVTGIHGPLEVHLVIIGEE